MHFKSKLAAVFGTALIILLWIGMLSYRSNVQAEEDHRLVTHTHRVIENLETVLTDVLDAETGERGYIITGDDSYLQPYEIALHRVSEDVGRIRSLTADNPRQHSSLERLDLLVAAKLDVLRSGIETRKRDGMAAGANAVRSGAGKQLMDQLRTLIDEMKQEEQRLLQERSEAVAGSSRYAKETIALGYLSAFFFLFGAGWLIYEEMHRRELAEEGLRRNEEQLRLLVSGVTDYAIFMLDPKGHVITWNAGAERVKGYSAFEILGQHFSRFYSPEDIERGKPDLELKIAAEQGRVEDEGWRVRKDGSRFRANVVITALRDETGRLRGFGEITWDTTQRRRSEEALQASEARFHNFAETSGDAIISADNHGNIVYFNPAAERIFSYSSSEIVGQPLTHLMPERYHNPHWQEFDRCLRTGEARVIGKNLELVGKRKDHSEFPIELSLSSWETREGIFFTATLSDITERKRAEDETLLRTAQLEAANKELEAFSYSVSHDLRAPLRHIDGFCEILTEDLGPDIPSSARNHLQRIRNASKRMGQLVDDLLNLARLGRKELAMQLTSLNGLLEEALADLKTETEGRRIEWRIGRLPFVECDPGLIKQVLTNLASNAVKFTRSREHAVIEIGHQMSEGCVVIFVRDNGVGFNMKYADKLFGVFQRLHRQEEFEGTGVGLAIVQRILSKHGGRIWSEAELEKGATFYFTTGPFPRPIKDDVCMVGDEA